jgi:hypothetical protein
MDSVAALRYMTMYIQSGTARALTMQGFNLGLTAQKQEAYNMGIRQSWKDLSEQQKQLVRQSLLMKEVGRVTADATEGELNLSKMMEHTNQQIETQKNVIGKFLAPIKVFKDMVLADIEVKLLKLGITAAEVFLTLGVTFVAALQAMKVAFDKFGAHVSAIWNHFIKGEWTEAWTEATTGGADILTGFYTDLQNNFDALMAAVKKSIEGLGDDFSTASKDAEEFGQQVTDVLDTVQETIDKLFAEYNKARTKLRADYQKDKDKLDADISKKSMKAVQDYVKDMRDIDQQAADDRAKAGEQYAIQEERDKQDHLRRMKELETQYLFDLQDAVRERDARQVLLLQRRYNMERAKAEDDFRVNAKRRQEDYQLELRDIDIQAQRKRVKRFQEYIQELNDINAEGEERRKALRAQLDADLAVLSEEYNTKLKDIFTALLEQGVDPAIVKAAAERVGLAWGNYAGAAAGNAFMGLVNQAINAAYSAMQNLSPTAHQAVYGDNGYKSVKAYKRALAGGFQTGGDFIATSPELITVGERPERVQISPLNRATGEAAGTMGGQGRAGGRGRVEVAISLGDGLQGAIVDQAMAEVADVFLTLNRADNARGAGGRR